MKLTNLNFFPGCKNYPLYIFSAIILAGAGFAVFFSLSLTAAGGTLSASVEALNQATGEVRINGVDSQAPSVPFTFNWGDGTIQEDWFPVSHVYSDRARNYTAQVTAHYAGGATDTVSVPVQFMVGVISPIPIPANLAVAIPSQPITLGTRAVYTPPAYSFFGNSYFTGPVSRSTLEYLLSLAAVIQYDLINENVFLPGGNFQQVVVRNPNTASGDTGASSLWYTTPVSFIAGNGVMSGTPSYNAFFHEMGHNMTLNSPAGYIYGGKIDGSANAIFSETMAQIFAQATAHKMVSSHAAYGLSDELSAQIQNSASQNSQFLADSYASYVSSGKQFRSWNDPNTPSDETFYTFLTLAYKFVARAEAANDYRTPLRRMTFFLQKFDADWLAQYAPASNTLAADTFRSTLMVAAMSYAFTADLRSEFVALNFPVSDTVYTQLFSRVGGGGKAPVISYFTASPTTITSGQTITLFWSVADAGNLAISGLGAVTGTSKQVAPTAATTYTLTATSDYGSATANVSVTVTSPTPTPTVTPTPTLTPTPTPTQTPTSTPVTVSPTVDLRINNFDHPPSVHAPANLSITWNTTNSSLLTGCSGAGQGWAGTKSIVSGNDAGGNLSNIPAGSYLYSITCTSSSGPAISDSVTIIVLASATPTPTVTLTLSPTQTLTPTPSTTPVSTASPTVAGAALLKNEQGKVYKVINNKIIWIPTVEVFNKQGLNWSQIQPVSSAQLGQYPRLKLVRAAGDAKVYYITEGGMKRHIPSIEVFNSYNNKWEDVVVANTVEVTSYPENTLIKLENDPKVYKLEGGKKRWIKTAEAFNRLKFDWTKIAPVNQTEFAVYLEGGAIE